MVHGGSDKGEKEPFRGEENGLNLSQQAILSPLPGGF